MIAHAPHRVGHKPLIGVLTSVAFTMVLGLATVSAAASSVPRVGVPKFSGPGARKVQGAAMKTIRAHGLKVVSDAEIKRAAKKLHVSMATEEGAQLIAVKLHLASIVTGRITMKMKALTLHVTVRDGGSGAVGDESTWSGNSPGALAHTVEKKMWRDLGPALRGKPVDEAPPNKTVEEVPAPADDLPVAKPSKRNDKQNIDEVFPDAPGRRTDAKEREAATEAPAEAEAAPPPPRERAPTVSARRRRAPDDQEMPSTRHQGPATLELAVGPRMLLRQLTYGSDPDNSLTPFGTKQPGPAIGGSAVLIPHLSNPRLGFSAEGEYAADMHAISDNNLEYKVAAADYLASALVGVRMGSLTADLVMGGGRQWFAFIPQGLARTRPRLVPDVTYDYVRVGLATRLYTSGSFSFLAAGYYRYIINAGAIRSRDWFPSAKIWGFQGSLGISYRIVSWLEMRLDADVRSYQLKMDPGAGDARATDSARDQYLTGWLSMVLRFGGEKR